MHIILRYLNGAPAEREYHPDPTRRDPWTEGDMPPRVWEQYKDFDDHMYFVSFFAREGDPSEGYYEDTHAEKLRVVNERLDLLEERPLAWPWLTLPERQKLQESLTIHNRRIGLVVTDNRITLNTDIDSEFRKRLVEVQDKCRRLASDILGFHDLP